MRQGWLTDAILWQEHIEESRHALRHAVRQPITQSEYDAKLQQAREHGAPVRELAEYLADRREDWADEDYEETVEWGRLVSEDASTGLSQKRSAGCATCCPGQPAGEGQGQGAEDPAGRLRRPARLPDQRSH